MKKERSRELNRGVTLIALVISIIVMLIISGISINAVMGDNGLITQAQDAKLMTELSNVLLGVESDVLSIKTSQLNYKLSASSVINFMNRYMNDKYEKDIEKGSVGVYKYTLLPKGTNIPNLKISVNGDVYVDNYKRGRVSLSENEILGKATAQLSDYVNVRVVDGLVGEFASNSDIIGVVPIEECPENSAVMWLNANSEVFAVGKTIMFLPTGLFDYEFSCMPIDTEEILNQFAKKYLINQTVQIKKVDNEYQAEVNVFHYTKNKTLEFLIKENEDDLYPTIQKEAIFGGTKIVAAGICISPTLEFPEGTVTCAYVNYNEDGVAQIILDDEYTQLDEYCMTIKESSLKDFAKANGGVKRIYYCNYVSYYKYKEEVTNPVTGKKEPVYKEDEEPSNMCFGAIKYIDL